MANDKPNTVQVPDGLIDRTADLLFWNHEDGPCYFVPRSVRLSDGKRDKTKVATLVVGELLKECILRRIDRTENESEPIVAEKGQVVGVWVNAGLRDLIYCHGQKCFVYATGETRALKDGNEMKVMKLHTSDTERKLIPLETDFRKESKKARVPWERAARPATPPKTGDDDDDDVPF